MSIDQTPTPPRGASPTQIRANQQNAKKSTGPRTAEGKARSSANALRHGIYADSRRAITHGLLGEDNAQVEHFLDTVVEELAPRNTVETSCANRIATLWLSQIRRDRYEVDLLREASLLTDAERYGLGSDPDELTGIIATLSKAVEWGRYHFEQNGPLGNGEHAHDDPFLAEPGLYRSMTLELANLIGEDGENTWATGIWDPTHTPAGPEEWQAALNRIVDDAFPALEPFLAFVQDALHRARAHRRLIIDRAGPQAAARSITVLERTLTTSDRLARDLRNAFHLYDALRSQNFGTPGDT